MEFDTSYTRSYYHDGLCTTGVRRSAISPGDVQRVSKGISEHKNEVFRGVRSLRFESHGEDGQFSFSTALITDVPFHFCMRTTCDVFFFATNATLPPVG